MMFINIIDNIIAAKSANKPTIIAYFIFLIPILEKYRLIIYMVVSVLPCIKEAILPILESGVYLV